MNREGSPMNTLNKVALSTQMKQKLQKFSLHLDEIQ